MVFRRTHLLSMCLMALASSIAITEYVMYTPVIMTGGVDEGALSDEELAESDDLSSSETSETNETTEANMSDLREGMSSLSEASSKPDSEPAAINTTENKDSSVTKLPSSDPFSPAGYAKVTVSKGDTLASVISKLGFDKTDIYLATKSLSQVFNLRSLKVGQEITVRGKRDKSGELTLTGLEFRVDEDKIVVSRNNDGFDSERNEIPVRKIVRNISGTISPKSPAFSLKQIGVKDRVATDALRALSQIVNIRTAKTPVDFEFLYQETYDDSGNIVRGADLLYASVFVNGKIKRVYKFKDGKNCEYVDSNGVILKTLASSSMLMHPLNRMKITSKFGIRRHPITGRIKGHSGVDLSAPIGTPIKAAANGTVQRASHYSGYGRYVNIKHSPTISTAYGHLSRIVVRSGQHVRQGQIIGYTGNSGFSTGPHLHYEVWKSGRPINPMKFVRQTPQKLTGHKMNKFNQFKKEINLQVVGLTPTSQSKTAKVKKIS